MPKKKYYAVRHGKVTGIFDTWELCKSAVEGISNCEYKSFPTKKEAEAYLKGEDPISEEHPTECPPDTAIAYVDGSFDAETGRYAFGCILLLPNGETVRKNGAADHPEAATARNVAGELLGTMTAIKETAARNIRNLIVCHDYNGIAAWYTGAWKAESFCAVKYLEFVKPYRQAMHITFHKVPAHTGVAYNEEADKLAKEALGLIETKRSEES